MFTVLSFAAFPVSRILADQKEKTKRGIIPRPFFSFKFMYCDTLRNSQGKQLLKAEDFLPFLLEAPPPFNSNPPPSAAADLIRC